MADFTETVHAAEFILSEANGHRSRENGTLASGTLVAGTVLQANGTGGLVAYTGDLNTAGALEDEAVGILLHDADASNGAVKVAYIARDAEVNLKLLTYPPQTTGGNEEEDVIASLARLCIICRD